MFSSPEADIALSGVCLRAEQCYCIGFARYLLCPGLLLGLLASPQDGSHACLRNIGGLCTELSEERLLLAENVYQNPARRRKIASLPPVFKWHAVI
jgi:hypothetical protein